MVKNLPARVGDVGDSGLVKGQENPLEEEMATHSSFLPGKFMDRRAWQATVYEVAKSQTKLSNQACL